MGDRAYPPTPASNNSNGPPTPHTVSLANDSNEMFNELQQCQIHKITQIQKKSLEDGHTFNCPLTWWNMKNSSPFTLGPATSCIPATSTPSAEFIAGLTIAKDCAAA